MLHFSVSAMNPVDANSAQCTRGIGDDILSQSTNVKVAMLRHDIAYEWKVLQTQTWQMRGVYAVR